MDVWDIHLAGSRLSLVDYPRAGAHYPRSTGEFLAWFGTDEDCLDYLEWLRWPGGFACRTAVMRAGGGSPTAGWSAVTAPGGPR